MATQDFTVKNGIIVNEGALIKGVTTFNSQVTLDVDLAVNGGDVTTTATGTATLFNTNATALNIGGAANVSIGAATGTTTINNANTVVTGDLAINGGDVTTTATTFNLINATATTASAFGAATTLNIGNTADSQTIGIGTASTAASTYNIGTGTTAAATTKTINLGTGGAVNSITNANIGSSQGGTTTINSPNITVNGNVTFTDSGTATKGVKGTAGANDQWFIGGGASATDGGFLEISTGDNGTEPIFVRQYSTGGPPSGTVTRTATLLDASGNTSFPGSITGNTLVSSVASGTAPLTVTSTTLVTNLNADLLDGLNSATANTVSTIVARDASGNFSAGTITATKFASSNTTSQSLTDAAAQYNGGSGAILLDDNGHKRISWNDGAGNFNIRAGNYYNGTNVVHVKGAADANSGAATMTMSTDATDGAIYFQVSAIGVPDATVAYSKTLTLSTAGMNYDGVITGTQLVSNIAIGTAPLVVTSTTKVTNLNADALDGLDESAFLRSNVSDNYTVGTLTFNSGTGLTAASGATVSFNNAQGTAPFAVVSTTLVTNLNADLLDGLNSATVNTASTIVARDASGGFSAGAISIASSSTIRAQGGEGGELIFEKGTTQTTLAGNVHVDTLGNVLRVFENGGTFRQLNFDLVTGAISGANVTASLVGNASTATTLATARTINGTSFNGSADITVGRLYDTSYRRITNPGGAEYVSQTSVVTGAIAVTLPVGMSDSMVRMTITVYEYTTNESFEITCGGYNYAPGTTWANNPFAYIVGNPSIDRRFTVRFGYDSVALKAVIYIGELASTWAYPQVYVTDVQVGYSGYSVNWTSGWTIGFEATAFKTVTATITNSQVGYAVSTNTANSTVLRDGSGNFSAGTITAALVGNATTSTSTTFVTSRDVDRNAGNTLPITSPQSVRFDFSNAGTTGTGGNYSGVMTFAPYTGTTASTGDASYQLAFGSTAVNGGGIPKLNIRKGIDSTWNAWYTLIHSGNTERSVWSTYGNSIGLVAGELAWKNYGNSHTIFDASAGTAPNGTAKSNSTPDVGWVATYPTLMGWNGTNTYGVKVDVAARLLGAEINTGASSTAGSVTGTWTLTAGSTWQATFADLAEWYDSDEDYESGTVVVFGGSHEVTVSTTANDHRVAGVVSANPAFIMNVDRPGPSACVALQGKVPVKVIGQVTKGDLLVTSGTPGVAVANNTAGPYTVIGKSLENKTTEEQGIVYVSVGR